MEWEEQKEDVVLAPLLQTGSRHLRTPNKNSVTLAGWKWAIPIAQSAQFRFFFILVHLGRRFRLSLSLPLSLSLSLLAFPFGVSVRHEPARNARTDYRVLPDLFQRFSALEAGSIGLGNEFYWALPGFYPVFTEFYWTWSALTGFGNGFFFSSSFFCTGIDPYWIIRDFYRVYRVYRVLLAFTEFYRVLPSCFPELLLIHYQIGLIESTLIGL